MFPGSPPPTHELRMCVQATREAVDELVGNSTEQAVAASLPLTNLTKLYYPNQPASDTPYFHCSQVKV